MPRTHWVPKNPYCRRSKLTKDSFEKLVHMYFMEVINNRTRSQCVEMLKWGADGFDITRQSMSKYFDKIGQLIWDNFIMPTDPLYKSDDVLDELLDFVYGKINKVSHRHNIAYKFLEDSPRNIKDPNTPVQRTLMFHLLLERTKVIRGYPENQFYLEFSRAFFICSSLEASGINVKSNYEFYEYLKSKKANNVCTYILLQILEEFPL